MKLLEVCAIQAPGITAMSLHPSSAFRQGAIALTTAAALLVGSAAHGQSVLTSSSPTQTVSAGDCRAFGKYILDEDSTSKLSDTFFDSVGAFVRANCQPTINGKVIQIITETDQDGASL